MLTFDPMTKGQISFLDKVCHVTSIEGELKENVHTKFQQPAIKFVPPKGHQSFWILNKMIFPE
jgi:hypothetical protein